MCLVDSFSVPIITAAMDTPELVKEEHGWVQSKPVGSDSYSAEMQMQEMGIVADKWKGTEVDQHDMRMLGRSQVLRVSLVDGFHGGKSR